MSLEDEVVSEGQSRVILNAIRSLLACNPDWLALRGRATIRDIL